MVGHMVDFVGRDVADGAWNAERRTFDAEFGRRTAIRNDDRLPERHRLGDAQAEPFAAVQRKIGVAGVRKGVDVPLRQEAVQQEEPVRDALRAGEFRQLVSLFGECVGPGRLEDEEGVFRVAECFREGPEGALRVLAEDRGGKVEIEEHGEPAGGKPVAGSDLRRGGKGSGVDRAEGIEEFPDGRPPGQFVPEHADVEIGHRRDLAFVPQSGPPFQEPRLELPERQLAFPDAGQFRKRSRSVDDMIESANAKGRARRQEIVDILRCDQAVSRHVECLEGDAACSQRTSQVPHHFP